MDITEFFYVCVYLPILTSLDFRTYMRILQNRMVHEIVRIFHAQHDRQIRLLQCCGLDPRIINDSKRFKEELNYTEVLSIKLDKKLHADIFWRFFHSLGKTLQD